MENYEIQVAKQDFWQQCVFSMLRAGLWGKEVPNLVAEVADSLTEAWVNRFLPEAKTTSPEKDLFKTVAVHPESWEPAPATNDEVPK